MPRKTRQKWKPFDPSFGDSSELRRSTRLQAQNHPNQTANESTLIFISIVLYRLTR